jgi:hypothetical protein
VDVLRQDRYWLTAAAAFPALYGGMSGTLSKTKVLLHVIRLLLISASLYMAESNY